ncbi:MAG: hypothetical protein ACREIP_18770, partial [Alphaproteobacteria bacterium]
MTDRPVPRPDSEAIRLYRRAVFYIAGFDNIGVRYYYMLFRNGLVQEFGREARRFKITRPEIAPDLSSRWRIETDDAGVPVEVDYFFLTPHDLVRKYVVRGDLGVIGAWAFTFFAYLRRNLFFRAFRKTWKAIILTYVLLSIPLFFLAGFAIALGAFALVDGALPPSAEIGIAAVAGALTLKVGLVMAAKTFTKLVLMSLYVGARQGMGRMRRLDARTLEWARFIQTRAGDGKWDEVLLVGHSSGTVAAVDIAAQLLRDSTWRGGTRLGLLTLGSTDTVVSAFRTATNHHDALATVATSPDIVWVEYWSPWDFISIGSHDPISAGDIDLGGRTKRGPILRALDLHQSLTRESYRRMFFN